LEPNKLCLPQGFFFLLSFENGQLEGELASEKPVLDLECAVIQREYIELVALKLALFG